MIEATKDKTGKGKTNTKTIFIIAIIAIVICIIGVVWFLNSSNVEIAQLVINSGTVEVKHEDTSWTEAYNGMKLYKSDSIRTGDNSSAAIIFYESSIIRLDNNTELRIDDIVIQNGESQVFMNQESGRTWNTVLKISGIDDYEVQTPTAVASVRGTSFCVVVYSNGSTYVGVGNGFVKVLSKYLNQSYFNVSLNKSEAVIVDIGNVTLPLEKGFFKKDKWILDNEKIDNPFRSDVKADLYERIDPYIPELKRRYGVTDQELDVLIEGYIAGYFDLPPDTPPWIRDIIELS